MSPDVPLKSLYVDGSNLSQQQVYEALVQTKDLGGEPESKSRPNGEAEMRAVACLTYRHAADFHCLPTLLTISKRLCTLAGAQHSYTY